MKAMNDKIKVAVYYRMGHVDESAMSFFQMMRKHYIEFIKSHGNWEFVGMYTDHSPGTAAPRPELERLLEACREGKVDLIITKNVSRIHRNIVDLITLARELRSLTPPVGIYFEDDRINTLDTRFDNLLTYMSQLAMEESRLKHQRIPPKRKRYDYPFDGLERGQPVDYLTHAVPKGECV